MSAVVSLPARRRSLWGDALRRMLSDRLTVIGLAIVGFALACALLAPQIAPYSR
jgi:N-terminal TM domain of oligopeptide transport permease C